MDKPLELSRQDIDGALARIGELACADDLFFELNVFGGAALAIAYDLRASTVDVDAVASVDNAKLRDIVRRIARERAWPDDWLNDAVKGFLSAHGEMAGVREMPGLRVQVPSLQYLIAMKAMAMRVDASDPTDRADLEALIQKAGYTTAEEVIAIVEAHYPQNRILPKTLFGIMEIVEAVNARRRSKP